MPKDLRPEVWGGTPPTASTIHHKAVREGRMRLYRTTSGCFIEEAGKGCLLKDAVWDHLLASDDLHATCTAALQDAADPAFLADLTLLAPVQSQEVWAAGVTYYRSRSARIEESKEAGGGDFYDRVYQAERPELFFKATGPRVIGPGGSVRIRSDARWSVPEPELTLVLSATGKITGCTIGNDMSSRDIEGENPLYLPQAKVYDGSCALGPCIWLSPTPLPLETLHIGLEIKRSGNVEFAATVALTELKRDPQILAEYLFRDNSFPAGCFLMTGTGIVPPDSFTLASGDVIEITIDPIGKLTNTVA